MLTVIDAKDAAAVDETGGGALVTVTDATVAGEDGDVGMKDAGEGGDVASTRENATFEESCRTEIVDPSTTISKPVECNDVGFANRVDV